MPKRKKLPQPEKMSLSEHLDKLGFIILVGLMERKEERAKRQRIVKNNHSHRIATNVCAYLSKAFPNCEINREELFEKTFDILSGCDIIWP